jgi:putative DNA primase/helicase
MSHANGAGRADFIREARTLVQAGWNLTPLGTIGTKAKVPIWKGWPDKPLTTVKEVDDHFTNTGYHGIGFIHGKRRDADFYTYGIDIDSRHGGDASLAEIEREFGPLPRTCVVRTPGNSTHYLCKSTEPVTNHDGIRPGIDIKGVHGQTVAPPTYVRYKRKETGEKVEGTYRWLARGELQLWPGLPAFLQRYGQGAHTYTTDDLGNDGARNNSEFHFALRMVLAGLKDEDKLYAALVSFGSTLDEGEARATIRSAIKFSQKQHERSDAGQAEYVRGLYGDGVCFDEASQKWFAYDGLRWKQDSGSEIQACIIDAARIRGRGAHHSAPLSLDKKERSDWVKSEIAFAVSCANAGRISNVRRLLEKQLIGPEPDQWDADPWLLCTPSGIIDLRTGARVTPNPRLYISHCTRVPYNPSATAPTWERVVSQWFEGDADFVAWLQRDLGYSITGLIGEQTWNLLHGDGANGKDKLVGIVRQILGDYATVANSSTFMEGGSPGDGASASPDLARLLGVRFVDSGETTGRKINHQRVKEMTGGGRLTARNLYGPLFDFAPRFKLWLHTNARPTVSDTSFGFWRRVIGIQFRVQFDEQSNPPRDNDLEQKLLAESEGILAWLVRGAREYHRLGLKPFPNKVREFVADYQGDNDIVGAFCAECVIAAPGERTKSSAVYLRFRHWCEDSGIPERAIMGDQHFAQEMKKRNEKKFYGGNPHYFGMQLRKAPSAGGIEFDPNH